MMVFAVSSDMGIKLLIVGYVFSGLVWSYMISKYLIYVEGRPCGFRCRVILFLFWPLSMILGFLNRLP